MKKTLQKGFTLIELLVVIAIIGILASVILASLNSARDKGNEAKIASQLSGARASAEIFYSNQSTPGYGTASALCTTQMFADTTSGMSKYTTASNYPSGTTLSCNSTATAYALMASFTSGGTAKYWCVDSTGASVVGATTAPTITDQDCD
jgi:prepilin-type N-terminal cleavage/methylation domain-containing protein